MTPQYDLALSDIRQGVTEWRMWGRQGWSDVRVRYRRTAFGPFWATLSLGIFMVSFSVVWANLWKLDVREYLSFVSAGMLSWTLISAIITEGTTTFISAESLIKSMGFPYTVLSCAVVWRNLIIFFHNIVAYLGVMVFCGVPVTWNSLLIVPGLLLIALNGIWVTTLLGMSGARYRDIQQLIVSILQILMFVTPIFWSPDQISGRAALVLILVDFNPLLHYVEIVRNPLLGKPTSFLNWEMALLGTLIGWCLTLYVFSRFRRRVAYWL